MELPNLFNDEIYRKCINLAQKSSGKFERYGSLLLNNNNILGEGYNRAIAHPRWKKNLDRIIRQGYSNHAEIESINDALMKGKDVKYSDIYVAGYFTDSNKLFFQDEFTCLKCSKKMLEYSISNIFIPTLDGWKKIPIESAIIDSEKYKSNANNKRKDLSQGDFYLNDFFK